MSIAFSREILCLVILLLLYSPETYACKPYLRGRGDTVDQLIQRTETIVIAKVKSYKKNDALAFSKTEKFDYVMEIISVLKGDKSKKVLALKEFDGPEVSDSEIEVGLDCYNYGGFSKDERYLIFEKSAHPKAYRRIDGENDPWLSEVKKKLMK